jgi:hypothetical protein
VLKGAAPGAVVEPDPRYEADCSARLMFVCTTQSSLLSFFIIGRFRIFARSAGAIRPRKPIVNLAINQPTFNKIKSWLGHALRFFITN